VLLKQAPSCVLVFKVLRGMLWGPAIRDPDDPAVVQCMIQWNYEMNFQTLKFQTNKNAPTVIHGICYKEW